MTAIRRLVVAMLLGVWCFPAVTLAKPLPPPSADVASRTTPRASAAEPSTEAEESALGTREQQSPDLQNFRGGAVSIYIGSGAVLILLIILLIVLL